MLRQILENIAVFQKKYAIPLLIGIILFTTILATGVPNMSLETDMSKQMPQDLPIYQLNEKIREDFGGQDTIMLLLMLEDSNDKNAPNDIRDPEIIQYLIDFENALQDESSIQGVTSPATFLKNMPFETTDDIIGYTSQIPGLNSFFSKDYTKTVMFITTDVGTSEKKIKEAVNLINDKIDYLATPPGIKILVSGSPPMQVTILELLWSDAIYTVLLASAIIFILLIILERSLSKALLIFTPLTLSIIWVSGTMGLTGLKLSFATAGLGAMILGLGVEYGVFMYSRYEEEREKGLNQLDALKVSVPSVGSAILGSGTTTIFGFLALTLSVMPMLQNLGVSLALGIFYALLAAIFVEPILLILKEDIEHAIIHHTHKKLEEKRKTLRQR